jgi:hypothetical protein
VITRPIRVFAGAALLLPNGLDLGQDPLAEQVARVRERVGDVGVQALEPARVGTAADAEVERRTAVSADLAARELTTEPPLLLGRAVEVVGELGVVVDGVAPTLHPARRLQPGHCSDELRARQVVRRREGIAGVVVRPLLGDDRRPVGAADRDAAECARGPTELSFNEGAVIHRRPA